jgi:hypothetical protein
MKILKRLLRVLVVLLIPIGICLMLLCLIIALISWIFTGKGETMFMIAGALGILPFMYLIEGDKIFNDRIIK